MPARDNEIQNLAHAYLVLDVPHDASQRAIKSSYRKLVKRWHPDRYRAGSEEHLEATQMTRLINAAYERIQDAPLRAGFATPFSTPRNSNPGTKSANDMGTEDGYWSREEYVERDPAVTDASFFRVLDYAQRAGAEDDAARPFDRVGFIVRFISGALFGVLLAFGAIAKSDVNSVRGAIAVSIILPIICGLTSGFGGDKFWRVVRPAGWWFWGRWN